MAKDYDHLFKLLIIGDSGKCDKQCRKYLLLGDTRILIYRKCHALLLRYFIVQSCNAYFRMYT